MADEQVLDLETISMEELKRLALAEAEVAQVDEPVQEVQPRDPQGRFAKQEDSLDNSADVDPAPAPAAETGEPTSKLFRREIDNADGSGVDVYEAPSLEELVEKISVGKANANKKIREQQQQINQFKAASKPRELSDSEEFVISQELMSKPSQAFKKLFHETTGYEITDFKSAIDRVDAFERAQREHQVQINFVNSHSDYEGNPDNGKRMAKWLEINGYPEMTEDGLHKAYLDLKASGLLKLKVEVADADTHVEAAATQRTVAPVVEAAQQRSVRKGSTIAAKGHTAPVVKVEPTEDELYSMDLSKLRDLANRQMADQK